MLQISLLLELLPRRVQQVAAVRAGIAEAALAERETRQADKGLDDGKQTLRVEGKRAVAQDFVIDCRVTGRGHCFPSFPIVAVSQKKQKNRLMLSHQTIEKPCLNSYQKSKIRNVAQVKCAVLSRKIDFCRKTRVVLT